MVEIKYHSLRRVGAKTYDRKYLDENPIDNVENQLADRVDVENEPEVVVERANSLGVPPPQLGRLGTREVQDAVVREPAPGKITRIVEVQKVKDTIDKSNATKSKGFQRFKGWRKKSKYLGGRSHPPVTLA